MAPDIIFVEFAYTDNGVLPGGVNWKEHHNETDIEYVRKDALMEWATQKWNEYTTRYHDGKCTSGEDWGQMVAFRTMIDKLNSM